MRDFLIVFGKFCFQNKIERLDHIPNLLARLYSALPVESHLIVILSEYRMFDSSDLLHQMGLPEYFWAVNV